MASERQMRDVNREVVQRKPVHDMTRVHDARKAWLSRWHDLQTEREPIRQFWGDLSRFILPLNYKLSVSARNRTSSAAYNAIYDNTATRALHTLESGMQSGMTNPSSDWFRLQTIDAGLRDRPEVRLWLDEVSERMRSVFARSNTYRVTHQMYGELGLFGTAAAIMGEDDETTIHLYPLVAGSYCLQRDFKGNVTACFREFQKTVREVVTEFGLENCSVSVQNDWQSGNLENEVDILHVVEPRSDRERERGNPGPLHMPWRSVYMELSGEDNRILRESGYRRFPVLAPRWVVYGDDVYGVSPAMEAFGDVKQLQQEQLRKGQGIDHGIRPALQVPTELRQRQSNLFPGGISYYDPGTILPYDQANPNGGVRRAFEVQLDMPSLLEDIQDVRMRIERAFYADLFLMLAHSGNDPRRTATEVIERQEEKLLALGPVLERLHVEMLKPLVENTFALMMDRGELPPMPPSLAGKAIEPEFVSILAQAQKAVGSAAIDRWIGNVLTVAQSVPDVLDKVAWDEYAQHYGSILGVPNKLLVDDDTVRMLRQARAQAQAAQAQTEMARDQAAAYRDIASVPPAATADAADTIAQAIS